MPTLQTVLVVEDSPVNLKILTGLLTRKGYRVLTAETGEEALAQVKTKQPDLIVLDIMLPGMDGYTTCKHLKADKATCDIPVIFISSLDGTKDKIGGFEAGGVDYITKPFQPAEVMARICTHLRICQLQRCQEEQNKQLAIEKQKSEALLLNVLPKRIARELIETGTCVPQLFEQTTVCFADIVNFTSASSRLTPQVIISELDDIFTRFDRISNKYKCERLKTIGDAYLFACGVPEKNPHHAENVALSALEMIDFLEKRNLEAAHHWQIRIGIHSGPVIGGVVGTEKYLYDIFGDTVNIASRIEELGHPMAVNVSSSSHALLKNNFSFAAGKETEVKGKGKLTMYTLIKKL